MHLDHVCSHHPKRMAWIEKTGCMPISWSFSKSVDSVAEIRGYLKNHAEIIRRISSEQFPCYFLAGVHPRNISPDLNPEQIRELLIPYLDNPRCLGVGEIGLETGSEREKEIFLAQMELAEEVAGRGKVFGIHTPRANKAAVTEKILNFLEPYRKYGDRIVVDHCRPDTIANVLSGGFWAGVTLSPVKASVRDVGEILLHQKEVASRVMLNTDSGIEFYEDLYGFVCGLETDSEMETALARDNAAAFFGIPAEG